MLHIDPVRDDEPTAREKLLHNATIAVNRHHPGKPRTERRELAREYAAKQLREMKRGGAFDPKRREKQLLDDRMRASGLVSPKSASALWTPR